MQVSFIVAGVQKGGTTVLHRRLKAHPQVGMPKGKESHFFFNDDFDWASPDYGVLHAEYMKRRGRMAFGQATPRTIFWEPAHARVCAYNPEMKFIILFRNPVDRAFSQWRMFRYRGVEDLSFSEAIREGRARAADRERSPATYKRFSYIERGMYAQQLETLLERFPRQAMLLSTSDRFRAEPDALLSDVATFIGVEDSWPVTKDRPSLSGPDTGERMSEEDKAYLWEVFAEDQASFVAMTGLGAHWRP